MDDVARMEPHDRRDLFNEAAGQRGDISAGVIEKDFWVCWTLKHIFALGPAPAQLIFKGGTSLSKVYGVIERFSEDIDLSLSREDLGFVGDRDPYSATTGKKKKESHQGNRRRDAARSLRRSFSRSFTLASRASSGRETRERRGA